ncbi:MAG TPA: CDP-alcohol phosphatidyltransferase family protein [Candidatus Limnocylindrales bacterium]|jgi:CDP-diacylglycerol--glycerol-3-phosphate 3-phosphatidyltransferase|nr:CDP-alcohol phosphatidyltransferase family protein [Candidatus Limnocylindrales bacterium]
MSGSLVSPEVRERVRAAAEPVALSLGRLGLTPNALTVAGFLGTCLAALAAAAQAWLAAGVLLLVFGIFDLFDGALARATGRVTRFGAFLDSTLDRSGENLLLAGIAIGCAQAGFTVGIVLAVLALAAASVVTYARARAESVGYRGEVGVAPRSERLAVLVVGLIVAGLLGGVGAGAGIGASGGAAASAGQIVLAVALGLIAVLSAVTVIQRIVYVRRQAAKE